MNNIHIYIKIPEVFLLFNKCFSNILHIMDYLNIFLCRNFEQKIQGVIPHMKSSTNPYDTSKTQY